MFFLQIILFFIFLIKKVNPIKIFILIYNNRYIINKTVKNITSTNIASSKKKLKTKNMLFDINNETQNKENKKHNYINQKELKEDINSSKKIIHKNVNTLKIILQSDKYDKDNNNHVPMVNINNKDYKKGFYQIINSEDNLLASKSKIKKLILKNNEIKCRKKLLRQNKGKTDTNIENKDKIKNKSNVNIIEFGRFLKYDEELQDMDYEEAIIYDERNYFRIFWSFLLENQIILGAFCTKNYLQLFCYKIKSFYFCFPNKFFLNAFFYTDDYISDAYHNNGVLDFITGLPKSIYSFIMTLITTNLLKMFCNSQSELLKVIKMRYKYNNYIYIYNQ